MILYFMIGLGLAATCVLANWKDFRDGGWRQWQAWLLLTVIAAAYPIIFLFAFMMLFTP